MNIEECGIDDMSKSIKDIRHILEYLIDKEKGVKISPELAKILSENVEILIQEYKKEVDKNRKMSEKK